MMQCLPLTEQGEQDKAGAAGASFDLHFTLSHCAAAVPLDGHVPSSTGPRFVKAATLIRRVSDQRLSAAAKAAEANGATHSAALRPHVTEG